MHPPDEIPTGRLRLRKLEFEGRLRRWALHPNISDTPRDAVVYGWGR